MHELELSPVAMENFPAAQFAQVVCPAFAWYVPAGQGLHADAPVVDEYWPASQLEQLLVESPVLAVNLPEAQSTQMVCPGESW